MVQTLVVPDPLAELSRLEGVPSAVVSARNAVDAVLRDRGLRAVTPQQSAEALLLSARASASLCVDAERWLAGSVRLATELIELSALVRVSPGQVVARAHALLTHGLVPDEELGRVRSDPVVSARLLDLNALLTTPTAASAIILGAVAHAELASVAPFALGNAILARAVEHMVLIGSGVDPRGVIMVEAGHLELRNAYGEALGGYEQGTVTGVRRWLLHCTQALAYGAEVSPVARRSG